MNASIGSSETAIGQFHFRELRVNANRRSRCTRWGLEESRNAGGVDLWLDATVRKFIEHLGRFDDTILGMTRTVVYTGPIGSAALGNSACRPAMEVRLRWNNVTWLINVRFQLAGSDEQR